MPLPTIKHQCNKVLCLNYGAINNFELEEGNDKDNVKLVAKTYNPRPNIVEEKQKKRKFGKKQKAQDVATSQRKIELFVVQTILSLKKVTTKMIET
jgi:hypothetical protein